MPMIDYKCNECGREFFEIVSSSDEKVQCPSCKSMNTKRIYKGKFYGKGSSCGGNCSCCGGCH